MKAYCEKIEELRKKLGWSQREAAEHYGIPFYTWMGWGSNHESKKPADWAARFLINDMECLLRAENPTFEAYLTAVEGLLREEYETAENSTARSVAEGRIFLLEKIRTAYRTINR